jgi:L-histidine N-alpha-methyltransferase
LELIEGLSARKPDDFCAAVHDGLSKCPKELPSRFFYDQRGSELFELITALPEYYPTRYEAGILQMHAAEIIASMGAGVSIVEFGSGSSAKTRMLLSAAISRQYDLWYIPIDISRTFLLESSEVLLSEYPSLRITAVASEYDEARELLPPPCGPRLILFLSSNIGNFVREVAIRFLSDIRAAMGPEDRLLIGADMVKDRKVLHLAYNDPAGVTAEFNRNLLGRINRELHGNFQTEEFRHEAPYSEEEQRIEMRLISTRRQEARVQDLETTYRFEKEEPIITEWSHKYTRESFGSLACAAGLRVAMEWTTANEWFSEFLLEPAV